MTKRRLGSLGSIRRRARQCKCDGGRSGQAIVELALMMPILLAVAILGITGAHMIDSAVQLAGAGSVAATAASADIAAGRSSNVSADAAAAANREEGLTCPSAQQCVTAVTSSQTGPGGTAMEKVTLSQSVYSPFPNVPSMTIRVMVVVST